MTNKEINAIVNISVQFKYAEDTINFARDAINNLLHPIPQQVIDDSARKEIRAFNAFLDDLRENCTTYKIGKYIEENSEEIFK